MKGYEEDKRVIVSPDVRKQIQEELAEFKDWKENKLENDRIIEIFGKKLKVIDRDRSAKDCIECALYNICWSLRQAACETTEHRFNRYFIEIH